MKKLSIFFMLIIATAGFTVGRYTVTSAPAELTLPITTANEDHLSDFLISEKVWMCAMHPQVRRTHTGECPICGMDLIAQDTSQPESERTLQLTEHALALADIQTTTVVRTHPKVTINLYGKLVYDETKVRSLTARFAARIDKLFVNYTGVEVTQGDHLAKLYSPELMAAQSELFTEYRINPTSSTTRAAIEKLRQWGLIDRQIDELLKKSTPDDQFEFKTPISGIVVRKKVNEGDFISTGQLLFSIADLSSLWLQLDAYEKELAWMRVGQQVYFSVHSYPGKKFSGNISFIGPQVDELTRTVSIRVNVANHQGYLKPGMFANATIISANANKDQHFAQHLKGKWISPMHPEIIKDTPGQCDICGMDLVPIESLGQVVEKGNKVPILVPETAVLITGERAIVYVKLDKQDRKFEGREVQLGLKAGKYYIVHSGLIEGEEVVTRGAFKLDSELQIRAKPSIMNSVRLSPSPQSTDMISHPAQEHSHHEH